MADKPAAVQIPSPATADRSGGFYGTIPQMTAGMTFREVGVTGLRAWSGWVKEEFLPELVGRQGAQKYREMQNNSPIIHGILFAIKSTMRKVSWRVIPAGDDEANPSPEAREAADFTESCMNDMTHPWEELVDENLSMLPYGYAAHEIVYKRRLGRDPGTDPQDPMGLDLPKSEYDDGRVGWRKIPIRGQDTILKWFFDQNGEIKGVTQLPYVGRMVDIPVEKMLLFRPSAHKNNPEGLSILRSSYLPYYFVKRLQEQEAIVGERMGGVPVLYIPGSTFENAVNDPKAAQALSIYKQLVTNVRIDEQMGAILPSDTYLDADGKRSTVKMYDFVLLTPQHGRSSVDADKTINIRRGELPREERANADVHDDY